MITKSKKLARLTRMKNWLIEHDVRFVEGDNGLIAVYNWHTGEVMFNIWATTERMLDIVNKEYTLGFENITKKLEEL